MKKLRFLALLLMTFFTFDLGSFVEAQSDPRQISTGMIYQVSTGTVNPIWYSPRIPNYRASDGRFRNLSPASSAWHGSKRSRQPLADFAWRRSLLDDGPASTGHIELGIRRRNLHQPYRIRQLQYRGDLHLLSCPENNRRGEPTAPGPSIGEPPKQPKTKPAPTEDQSIACKKFPSFCKLQHLQLLQVRKGFVVTDDGAEGTIMVTRRQILLGGALTLVLGERIGWCAQGQGRAVRTSGAHGCILQEAYASPFMETSKGEQFYSTGTETVIGSSGDRDFDFALAQTLARISDLFDVLPGFGFYDDYDRKNAFATRAVRAGRGDGTVLFGQRMLKDFACGARGARRGCSLCMRATNLGYILQFKSNLQSYRFGADQPTGKRVELQADYFAGFFAVLENVRGRSSQRPFSPSLSSIWAT